jgi:CRISPR-associated endonuclease Csn1
MATILGLDLGTNSIGWAVVDKTNGKYSLKNKGVRIFQEGVKIEKGIENSKAAERTSFRSSRRLKYRRKLRKIATLRVLSSYGYCPSLTEQELDGWRFERKYPDNDNLRNWWQTNEQENKHPYYCRNIAVTKKLDLGSEYNRHLIGRAFYHMAQRRGFLSNRLDSTQEHDGAVKSNIEEISRAKGDKTIGQYFYTKYLNGEKIRDQYTSRENHYLEEFERICDIQRLPEEFRDKLHNAIFFQRPMKSQKGLIGKCVFEQAKQRCSVSHPLYEEYRMLCLVNNIQIKTPEDEKLRPLNKEERAAAIERFYLKRDHFPFEEIAKAIAPGKRFKFFKEREKTPEDYLFNYPMKTTVTGNPLSARLKDFFGDNFLNFRISHLRKKDGTMSDLDIHDVWHVLMRFNSEEKLKTFAEEKLGLDNEQSKAFAKIRLKQDFASLSLNAIKKILPFLRSGLIYSHAVLLANVGKALPVHVWMKNENHVLIAREIEEIIHAHHEKKEIIDVVNGLIKKCRDNGECWSEEAVPWFRKDIIKGFEALYGEKTFGLLDKGKSERLLDESMKLFKQQMQRNLNRGEFVKVRTIVERVQNYLIEEHGAHEDDVAKIYHPSAIDVYQPAERSLDGKKYLNSPTISSIRNPMAMRAMHQLRKVVNELISHEIINERTKVQIEMSRGLLNANERNALQSWQRDRETLRKDYAEKIKAHFLAQGIEAEPTSDEILKYQLWEEQNHKCIYTNEEIGLSEFIGADPGYDIEHTIPRSLSYDNSQENKTLCNKRFNRSVKRNQIPSTLDNHEDIVGRIDSLWKEKIESLDKQIQVAIRQSGAALDKNTKDRAIQKRHRLVYERNYFRNKRNRFLMNEIPQGFKNSQLVDTGIITKYARLFLMTVFEQVYTVKGSTVADFRIMWGIQNEYEKKARVNHIHHCVDALVIACMSREQYEALAKYYHDREDSYLRAVTLKPRVELPWPSFTEDVRNIESEILVSHHTPDVLHKQSKKKLRKRGRIVKNIAGEALCQIGDTARASLHKDTFYGAIETVQADEDGHKKKMIKYVVRKPLDSIDDGNLKHIVDERVRNIVESGRKKEKLLKKQIEELKKNRTKADDQEEHEIDYKIERIEKEIVNLYTLPNKNGAPVPIKKVRMFTPMVTNPIKLKKHRDKAQKAPKPHKENYYVMNDGNYLMAIYEGKNKAGKIKRAFEIRSNLEAAEFYKFSVRNVLKAQGFTQQTDLVPVIKQVQELDLQLKYIIKVGSLVLFWEETPEEVLGLENCDIRKRLYKVVGLSSQRIISSNGKINEYATIVLRFHQESRPASELRTEDGAFAFEEKHKAQRKVNHNQFNALVEGYDFELDPLGSIRFIKPSYHA